MLKNVLIDGDFVRINTCKIKEDYRCRYVSRRRGQRFVVLVFRDTTA